MKFAVALALALVALGVGLWIFFGEGTDRRLRGLIETSVEYSEISDPSVRFGNSTEDRSRCGGEVDFADREVVSVFGRIGRIAAPEVDYRQAAIRAADRFEAEGWEVQRSIPDPDGSITTNWIVEAIRSDENVVAGYGELGDFDFTARVTPCPKFLDQRTRLIVEDFPGSE